MLVTVQRDATQSSLFIILQVHSTYFGSCWPPSNVAKLGLATLEGGSFTQKIWPVPEAVVTVLCTPDDGCFWYPKHVEWTCRIINRLLCVASRWIIINILRELLILSCTMDRVCQRDGFITEYGRKLKSQENYIYEHMRGDMEVSATPILFFIPKKSFFFFFLLMSWRGTNPQRWGKAHTLPNCCVVLCIVCLCRSVYCLCVKVYCTTATRWLPNCS